VGIVPTPAVAYLTNLYNASCGIVISASHNPAQDNGFKFFSSNGYKLSDAIEEEIEKLVLGGTQALLRASGDSVGRVYEVHEAYNKYSSHLLNSYTGENPLNNMAVVIDCGHGAAYEVAPEVWNALGAKVVVINNQPNGLNINLNCGSTHTEELKQAVVAHKAHLGVAYDGDADRCIIIDERGNELDGDYIILICALDLHRRGLLKPAAVVATVMSNIGLDLALRQENIDVNSCGVGDRYVIEKMVEKGAIIGGEQSGHIIFSQHSTTGDGILTSLKIAEVMARNQVPISDLAAEMEKQPQVLINVKMDRKNQILAHEKVQKALTDAEQKLGDRGKLVVRPSGTEPVVRLMAQGRDLLLLEEVIDNIKRTIEEVQGQSQ
jgi:phosphoglucosamine mutase